MSKGGKSTKTHLVTNDQGHPLAVLITEGQAGDARYAIPLLETVLECGSNVTGDRAYSSIEIRRYIENHSATYTIPPTRQYKEPWEYDRVVYATRNVIERIFKRMKDFRGFASRYDKLARNYRATIYCILIYLMTE